MIDSIPPPAIAHGFRVEPLGTHTSRTIMLREARLLFDAAAPETDYDEMRRLVIDENVTLKRTLSTRRETFRRLAELYGLRREVVLYRALRDLWHLEPKEQPLLALLCALARDPLLRATALCVLDTAVGEPITKQQLADQVAAAFPDRYRPGVLAGLGRRTISSWEQSGHLAGRGHKVRSRAVHGAASAAYALLLGYLCEARGSFLFETSWARALDAPSAELDALAFAGSQRGWLDYRRLGDVYELRFSYLLRP